jgi:hypothetical protein
LATQKVTFVFMAQDNLEKLNLADEKPLENEKPPEDKLFPPQKRSRDWIGFKRVTLFGALGSCLALTTPIALAVWGFWQTENNTMLSREQDIKKDYRAKDDQNAKLVAEYYGAMTKYMENKKFLKDDQMKEVIKARTLNVFSQLSDTPNQNEYTQIGGTVQKFKSVKQTEFLIYHPYLFGIVYLEGHKKS